MICSENKVNNFDAWGPTNSLEQVNLRSDLWQVGEAELGSGKCSKGWQFAPREC